MKDKNMTVMGSRYGTHLTDYGVWMIQTRNVCCYLIEGREKAMLIDGIPPMMWGGDRKLIRYRYKKASFVCSK